MLLQTFFQHVEEWEEFQTKHPGFYHLDFTVTTLLCLLHYYPYTPGLGHGVAPPGRRKSWQAKCSVQHLKLLLLLLFFLYFFFQVVGMTED